MRRLTPYLALLLMLLPSVALAWVQSTSSKGAPIHWDEPCIPIYWNENGSDNVAGDTDDQAFLLSLETWNAVDCSHAELQFAGLTNSTVTNYEQENPPYSLVIFREKGWPYAQRPVAFTSVTYNPNTGLVVDADIEINGEDFDFTTKPVLNGHFIDVQNTLTHELGHVLGFDHNPNPESTMFPQTTTGDTGMRTLDQTDVDGVCKVYPADQFGVCTPVEAAYFDVELLPSEQPSDEGCSASAGVGSGPGGLAMVLLLLSLALLWLVLRTVRRRISIHGSLSSVGLGLLVLGASCLASAEARAWVQYTSSTGAPVQWPLGTCELRFSADNQTIPGVPEGQEIAAINAAFEAWNSVGCGPVKFLLEETLLIHAEADAYDGVNQIAFVDDKWPKSPNYLALTTLTYYKETGEIYDADIELNLYLFDFSDCQNLTPDRAATNVNYPYALLHEVGHLYGLDHSAVPEALLYSSGAPYCDQSLPMVVSEDDQAGKCAIYGGDDYANATCNGTVDPEPSPENADVVEPPDGGPDTDWQSSDVMAPDGDVKCDPPCCSAGGRLSATPTPLAFAFLFLFLLAGAAKAVAWRRLRSDRGVRR